MNAEKGEENMKLADRLSQIKPSPTLAISAKAKAMKAQGIDIIGFGAGEPDFDTPDHIKDAAKGALDEGFTKYTAAGGIDELKDAVIDTFARDYGLHFDRPEVLIGCGAKHILYNIFQALCQEGDEVIIQAPYWVSYPPQVLLASATPVIIETSEADGFVIDPDALEKAITPRTKAIVLNSPSNPTGAVYERDELEKIAGIVADHDLYVISDDIYEKIMYDGVPFVSITSFGREIADKTIVVNGVSKSHSMTGWRIGYAAGPKALIGAMTRIQSQSTSNPTSIAQKAAVAALRGPQECIQEMVVEFTRRRARIMEMFDAMEGVTCLKPRGSFYAFPNVSALYGKRFDGKEIRGSLDLTEYLMEQAKVAVVPGAPFGADEHIRLSFAMDMESMVKGLERITAALAALG